MSRDEAPPAATISSRAKASWIVLTGERCHAYSTALLLTMRPIQLNRVTSARNWDASLLNNLGMTHADAGEWPAALAAFEEALVARERIGDAGRTRVARWMVGWALRNLGRTDEALAVQTALKAELDAIGEEDPYVDEELALLDG